MCLSGVTVGGVTAQEIEHEHPDDASTESDLEGVQRWLGDRIDDVHVDCAEGISIGNFDACEDLDSEEYESLLDRYATVEGETEGDSTTAEQVNETRNTQREYAKLREEFDETFEEYEAAREAGNDAEARARARELQELADRIEELGGELEVTFRELDSTSELELTNAAESINRSTEEVRVVRITVETETFTETRINATVSNATASFADPTVVSGRLVDHNGTAIENGTVALYDGTDTYHARTDENGTYAVAYRPVRTPQGEADLTVEYRPETGEPYLSSTATTNVTVTGTDASLQTETVPATLSFENRSIVAGTVTATGEPVEGVEVTIFVDRRELTSTRTSENGTFRTGVELPPTVPSGDAELRVGVSNAGYAIEPVTWSTPVEIEETPTELDGMVTDTDDSITLSGRLTTTGEREVGNRPLTVRLDEDIHTIQTEADGRYSAKFERETPPETVVVQYDESASNLAPAEWERTLGEDAGPRSALLSPLQSIGQLFADSPLLAGGGAIVLVGGVAVGAATLRSRRRSGLQSEDGAKDSIEVSDTTAESGPSAPTHIVATDLIDLAKERADSNPELAVRTSYAAVRSVLTPDGDGARTHRELYRQHARELDEPRSSALLELTNVFERATFANAEVRVEHAETALAAAERYLLSDSDLEPTPTD